MHFMWLNKHNSLYSGYLDVKGLVVCPAYCCAQPTAPGVCAAASDLIKAVLYQAPVAALSEAGASAVGLFYKGCSLWAREGGRSPETACSRAHGL